MEPNTISKHTSELAVLKAEEINLKYNYSVGDKVILLDNNESAIVYKELDKLNNLTVFYKREFIEVNYKRVRLELSANELYPEDYDLNQIFIAYKDRKLEHDITRGSKKVLKKIRKTLI